MNWYFEKAGSSQGPITEEALATLVRAKEVMGDGLVWHVGLEDWKPVRELRPAWLQPVVVAQPTATPSAAKPTPTIKTQPAAAVVAAITAESPKKPGLLTRLFGFGKGK